MSTIVRHRPAWSLLYMALGLSGCGEVTGLPSPEPVPVLQGLLVFGETRHPLRVTWSSPTHVPYEPTSRPVDDTLVDLWLVAPTGDSARYAPTGLAGEFSVVATMVAGEIYRLSGSVAARAVTAQTVMPATLVVGQPAADTLRLRIEGDLSPYVTFAWRAEFAVSYQALLEHDDGTRHSAYVVRGMDSDGFLLDIAPDTTGELLLLPPRPGVPDTALLVILGYDRAATGFFSFTPKSNVHGAFGVFGAAAKAEKVVVWE